MLNKSILQSVRAASEVREQQKKERGEQQTYKQGLPRIAYVTNEPLFFSFLTKVLVELPIHFVFDKQTNIMDHVICERLYEGTLDQLESPTECPHCNVLTDKGRMSRPTDVLVTTVYAHSLEGKKGTSKKTQKEFEFDPITNLVIRPGKGKANFEAIDVLKNKAIKGQPGKSALDPGMYVFEISKSGKGVETQYHAPKLIPDEMLGDEFDRHSAKAKAALEEASKQSEEVQYQRILGSFGNCKWEVFGLDEPSSDSVESKEVTTQSAGKKAKNELD